MACMTAARLLPPILLAGLLGGCAENPDRPVMPGGGGQGVLAEDPVRPDPAGTEVDVRTITDTADEPEGPISPAGAELSPQSDVGPPAGYRTVGGVLVDSAGKAVFADEVVAARRNELRGLAKRVRGREEFMRAATGVIVDEVGGRLNRLLTRNVLERHTDAREQALAENLTTVWRERFITDHGGSEARARAAARERANLNLEELTEDEYLRRLGEIFLRKRILPGARPAAQDLRDEYRRLLAAGDLTEPGTIAFSLIEVRPESAGDPAGLTRALTRAEARANGLLGRALAGEDFARLARDNTDSPSYAARDGRLPEALIPLRRGAFAVPAVEAAAWGVDAGAVVPEVVSAGEGESRRFYVVRVDDKTPEVTLSFAEAQKGIEGVLLQRRQAELMGEFLDIERGRLQLPEDEGQEAVMRTVMEIVGQNYEAWRDS